ncbi:MAG: GH116 family glycosyl-hydrolase [Planctomycetota bacterium]
MVVIIKRTAGTVTGQEYNECYTGEYLNRVAFPLGGIGAGMICLEGSGMLSHFSLRHRPDIFNEPTVFSAICVKDSVNIARVLEGPVPGWKIMFPRGASLASSGNGAQGKNYGLPRFQKAAFSAGFPFASVTLQDKAIPLEVSVTGWSPFTPGDADRSSLPVAALEFAFRNPTPNKIEAVYSFHATNFMALEEGSSGVGKAGNGFLLWFIPNRREGQEGVPDSKGEFSAVIDDPNTVVNCAWFRGGWFDSLTMLWKSVVEGEMPQGSPVRDGARGWTTNNENL